MASTALPHRVFKRGEALFREGEPGKEAYLIESGFVSITRMEAERRISLATRAEGEIVGEMALIDDTTRSATVTAESDKVEVRVLTRDDLEGALRQAPEVLQTLLHQLLESLRTANDLIGMYAARLAELTEKSP